MGGGNSIQTHAMLRQGGDRFWWVEGLVGIMIFEDRCLCFGNVEKRQPIIGVFAEINTIVLVG